MTASHSGLASPGSSPWASVSPPTSTWSTSRSQSRAAAAAASCPRSRADRGWVIDQHGLRAQWRAMCDSAKRMPASNLRVPASARAAVDGASPWPSPISATLRGPGRGSITRRSQLTPPTTVCSPQSLAPERAWIGADHVATTADAQRQRLRGSKRSMSRLRSGECGVSASEAIAYCDLLRGVARSNSSSAITGVPSNGRSRWISSHDVNPRTHRAPRTVTGRGIL